MAAAVLPCLILYPVALKWFIQGVVTLRMRSVLRYLVYVWAAVLTLGILPAGFLVGRGRTSDAVAAPLPVRSGSPVCGGEVARVTSVGGELVSDGGKCCLRVTIAN